MTNKPETEKCEYIKDREKGGMRNVNEQVILESLAGGVEST